MVTTRTTHTSHSRRRGTKQNARTQHRPPIITQTIQNNHIHTSHCHHSTTYKLIKKHLHHNMAWKEYKQALKTTLKGLNLSIDNAEHSSDEEEDYSYYKPPKQDRNIYIRPPRRYSTRAFTKGTKTRIDNYFPYLLEHRYRQQPPTTYESTPKLPPNHWRRKQAKYITDRSGVPLIATKEQWVDVYPHQYQEPQFWGDTIHQLPPHEHRIVATERERQLQGYLDTTWATGNLATPLDELIVSIELSERNLRYRWRYLPHTHEPVPQLQRQELVALQNPATIGLRRLIAHCQQDAETLRGEIPPSEEDAAKAWIQSQNQAGPFLHEYPFANRSTPRKRTG